MRRRVDMFRRLSLAFPGSLVLALGCAGGRDLEPLGANAERAPRVATVGRTLDRSASAILVTTKDTSVCASAPNQNFGSAKVLAGNRALIEIEPAALAAAVGTTDYVTAAKLVATLVDSPGRQQAAPRTVTVQRVRKPWKESGATWSCAADTDISNERPDCGASSAWRMSIADDAFANEASSSSVVPASGTGTVEFDVATDVRAFLAGSTPNHGWLIESPLVGEFPDFGSREGGDPARLMIELRRCNPTLCDDGDACTSDSCDVTAHCVHAPAANGSGCNDDVAPRQPCGAGAIPGRDLDELSMKPPVPEAGGSNTEIGAFGSAFAQTRLRERTLRHERHQRR